jgi:hypothetical protein
MNTNLDIVELIERNPITRLNREYQNKFIVKVKKYFTESQQQLFVSSFYCYLNYNSDTDFIIELDKVWKWLGFSRKDHCKIVIEKHFTKNIDYKILLPNLGEQVHGGVNKETIIMNIYTFKKLCLKSNTKKADVFKLFKDNVINSL